MKKRFFKVLVIFTLFSSLGFTAPLYVECQDLYPDEWLDLFGTIHNSVDLTTVLIPRPVPFSSSHLISNDLAFERQYLKILSLQPFTSELVMSVNLRC